jgi:hypothetical protein
MKHVLTPALAAAALCACASTTTTPSTSATPSQVTTGQALLGATLGADTALRALSVYNDSGQLSAANCRTVAADLPDAVAALGAADVAWNAADATTLQAQLAEALQMVPILTGLAATPAAPATPASPVTKSSTLATIVALVPSLLSAAEDAEAVSAANTVPALQTAIPAAQSQLAADAADFGC